VVAVAAGVVSASTEAGADVVGAVRRYVEDAVKISMRNCDNPNHHLWNNNGSWWLNLTVHKDDYTKERIRRPLRTRDVEYARAKRDYVLQNGVEAL
jgi:hypothetical protein